MSVSLSSEFDIFAPKPVQASVDQSDLEFLIPADSDTYINLIIRLYIRGKLTKNCGRNLDNTDFTAVTNNFLHSLFSQCSIALNGVTITQATELYYYHSFFETILTYCSDAATSFLTNAFWYLDDGDLLPCDPTAADAKNKDFITGWDRIKQNKEVQHYGRIHSDICNVPLNVIPGLRLQIGLTKAKSRFYLMNKVDSTTVFKFLDAQLLVNRVRPSPSLLLAHNTTLAKVLSHGII